MRKTSIIRIEWQGWTYVIEGQALKMCFDGKEMAALPLALIVNGERREPGAWREAGEDHYQAAVRGVGSAHVGVREGQVAFWLETRRKQFDSLTWFPGTTFRGDRWQSFVSDGWDRQWHKDLDKEVGLSSAYLDIMNVFGADGAGLTDPGDNPPTFVWNTTRTGGSVT